MVLDRIKRDRDSAAQSQFACPHTARQYDELRLNSALLGQDSSDPSVGMLDFQSSALLHYRSAFALCAFCESKRNLFRQHLSVVRQPRTAENVIGSQQWPFFRHDLRTDNLDLNSKQFGHCRSATELNHAVLAFGSNQTADLFPSDGMAGFLFQPGVKLRAVLIDLGETVARAQSA